MLKFSDVIGEEKTLLFLMGSLSGVAVNLLGDLGMLRPVLSKHLQVRTMVISMGTWEQMNEFRQMHKSVLTNITIYQDPSGALFENMGCKKNKFSLLKKVNGLSKTNFISVGNSRG
jgi:hypothetical protein